MIDFENVFMSVPEKRSVIKHQYIWRSILLNCPTEYFVFEML